MLVKVTKQDIEGGERESTNHCPIARAISKRQGVLGANVDVAEQRVNWWTAKNEFRARLPPRMAGWADDFDDGRPVKPTSFLLAPRALS